jgi:hypothetical protein
MSRADRFEKQLRELAALEATYETLLRAELHACASGAWGLFGQNDVTYAGLARNLKTRLTRASVTELLRRGDEIAALRRTLILEPYRWHARLIAERKTRGSSAPGESTLARQLLAEMDA